MMRMDFYWIVDINLNINMMNMGIQMVGIDYNYQMVELVFVVMDL